MGQRLYQMWEGITWQITQKRWGICASRQPWKGQLSKYSMGTDVPEQAQPPTLIPPYFPRC